MIDSFNLERFQSVNFYGLQMGMIEIELSFNKKITSTPPQFPVKKGDVNSKNSYNGK